ncbi:LysR substrate-binding domain-containing protein [Cupriavidus basilensis]
MNLRAIDLNLLTVLDALLDEAHVSRAAQRAWACPSRLPPAHWSAAATCSGDRLLERAPGGMQLTPRAQALRAPLKRGAGVGGRGDRCAGGGSGEFVADRARAHGGPSRRAGGESSCIVSCPQALPGLNLVLQPWQGGDAALESLARGDSDLAVSVFPAPGTDFRCRPLLREHYVVAMRAGHPAAAGFSLARWLDFPHVLVSGRGESRTPLDDALAALGLSRRVGMVVPEFHDGAAAAWRIPT